MRPLSLRGGLGNLPFSRTRAFSLVEVTLALGLAAFVLIALVGLIPMGIHSSNESVEESRALNVLGAIATDRSATPFDKVGNRYPLPVLRSTQASEIKGFFGVGEDFKSTGETLTSARYRIDYRVLPPPSGQDGPFFVSLRASWPPMAVKPANSVEIVTTFSPQ